jgi:ankyrin repeat protein
MPDNLILSIASGNSVSLGDITRLEIDINASGANNKRTALTAAAFAGNCSLIRGLAKYGADLDHYDQSGVPAILEAASMGHLDAVGTLLEFGVDIETKSRCGNTALMVAAAWGYSEVVSFLLARGADINHCDVRGGTALMIAEEKEQEHLAAILRSVSGVSQSSATQPDTA